MAASPPPQPAGGGTAVGWLANLLVTGALMAGCWWAGRVTAPHAGPVAVTIDSPVRVAVDTPLPVPAPVVPPAPPPTPSPQGDVDPAMRAAAKGYFGSVLTEFAVFGQSTEPGRRFQDVEAALAVVQDGRKAEFKTAWKAIVRPAVAADGSYPDSAAATAAWERVRLAVLAGMRDASR